jgi:uncharacterized protein (TIGR02453 family)
VSFRGFPAESLDFYRGLEADNSKAYWTAHRQVYEQSVKQPMLALAEEVADDFKPLRLFRPNRDVRFSADKSPYKTMAGLVGEREGGALYYVQISSAGLLAGSGYYAMASDQLARFREAVDDGRKGPKIAAVAADLEKAGCIVGAIDELKSAPRGYPKDHPRIALLRRKGLFAGRSWPVAAWLHTAKARARIEQAWREAEPLNAWLDANVGPSQLQPS